MAQGIFFFIVGPSGAGKDSLIDGARASTVLGDRYLFARRVITRPAGSPGEDHLAMTDAEFDDALLQNHFLISWQAHGLRYSLSRDLLNALDAGQHVIANGSRNMIRELAGKVPHLVVIEVTAPPALLAQRILGRRRENEQQALQRMQRTVEPLPTEIDTLRVMNDSTLDAGVARFIDALETATQRYPAAAIPLRESASPTSRDALNRKMRGETLSEQDYQMLIRDIIDDRYSEDEISTFLIATASNLTDEEVLSLARVRARFATQLHWDEPIVVDKHSMGGVPGSRITLIVVPIVAAFGLAMPKTSSRAITSAAGTADAMETVAKVDLNLNEVQQCVKAARACIAWNGKLNHSRVDDVMNAITRPLAIDARRWSVASILSKKLAAGSTHVIIDLPYGEKTKLKSLVEAKALRDLFEQMGERLGLQVKAFATKGSAPIGRGIGPALEVRDVRWVLDNHPDAPIDLKEKALFFAGHILSWSPQVGNYENGRLIAEKLLENGEASQAFDRIITAQGACDPVLPSPIFSEIHAMQSGRVSAVDGWTISEIARLSGAPVDKSAGIDLLCKPGDLIGEGEVIYRIHAKNADNLEAAVRLAQVNPGVSLEG